MKTKSPEDLKPCPFCGAENTEMLDTGSNTLPPKRYFVACHTCGTTSRSCTNKIDAFQAWNTRKASESSSGQNTEAIAAQLVAAMISNCRGDIGGRDQEMLFAEIALDFVDALRSKIAIREA